MKGFSLSTLLVVHAALFLRAEMWGAAPPANPQNEPVTITSFRQAGTNLVVGWKGAIPPYRLQFLSYATNRWQGRDISFHLYSSSITTPITGEIGFFRVRTIPDTVVPPVPALLNVVTNSCRQATVRWQAVEDVAGGTGLKGYNIYRNGAFLAQIPVASVSFVDGLEPLTTYSYAVSAVDKANNESPLTAAVSVRMPPCPSEIAPGIMEPVGYFPTVGVARDVALQGDYAYVACDQIGLSVLRISVPQAPHVVGVATFSFSGTDVAVDGNIAIVTGSRFHYVSTNVSVAVNGYYVFDVSNPAQPYLLSRIEDNGNYRAVALAGRYAYLSNPTQFQVIDLINPWFPRPVGFSTEVGPGSSIVVRSNRAYAVNGTGLRILDISNSAAPAVIGSVTTSNNAAKVSVVGRYAYIAAVSSLEIVDLQNERAPQRIGSWRGTALAVDVEGDLAYLAASSAGLSIVNVSNRSSPVLAQNVARPAGGRGGALGVAVREGYAFLAYGAGGFSVIQNRVAPPTPVSSGMESFEGYQIAAQSNLVLVAGARRLADYSVINELRFLNVSNPARPQLITKLEATNLNFNGAAIWGPYVYLACGWSGIKVVSLANPQQNFLLPPIDTSGEALSVTVSGGFLYAAAGSAGLKIYSLVNPLLPILVGSLDTAGNAVGVAVSGNRAYIGDANAVRVIDITIKALPTLLGSVSTTAFAVQVADNGDVYTAASTDGLVAINVSDPRNPQKRALLPPTGGSNGKTLGFVLVGNRAYIGNGEGGFALADISNPAAPRLEQSVLTLGSCRSVAVVGDWAFLSDTLGGITNLRLR